MTGRLQCSDDIACGAVATSVDEQVDAILEESCYHCGGVGRGSAT